MQTIKIVGMNGLAYCPKCKAVYHLKKECNCDIPEIVDFSKAFNTQSKRRKRSCEPIDHVKTMKVPIEIELKRKDGTIVKLKAKRIVRDTSKANEGKLDGD